MYPKDKDFYVQCTENSQNRLVVKKLMELGFKNPRNFKGSDTISTKYGVFNSEIDGISVYSSSNRYITISFEEFMKPENVFYSSNIDLTKTLIQL